MSDPATEACPRCGAPRDPQQEYCVDCGLRLPATGGPVPRLRRTWVRRLGWYPGDWIWTAMLAFLVAGIAAAVAIAATQRADSNTGTTFVATSSVPVKTPTTPEPTVNTTTLPVAPEPTTGATTSRPPVQPPPGETTWPAGQTGWTVVLESLPVAGGRAAALDKASGAAHDGLPETGVLDSSRYPSLHPGYFVIFSGIYTSQADAQSALPTARNAGFRAAYVRQITA